MVINIGATKNSTPIPPLYHPYRVAYRYRSRNRYRYRSRNRRIRKKGISASALHLSHFISEVLNILFDFDYFSKMVEHVYDMTPTPYTKEEVLSVFEYFLSAYEAETGNCHPGIRRDQIARIIKVMPFIDLQTHGTSADIDPEDYPDIIEAYFQTYFPNCDYRINHFFSGRVREIRYYENLI